MLSLQLAACYHRLQAAAGVEVGVGDFAEVVVVTVARAGLLAPAAQAESAQLTPQLTPVSDDSVGLSSYPSGLYCRVQTAVFWS